MTARLPKALQFEIHGLNFAALAWGDPAQPPLLALHGWLDNAASFSMLGPYFTDYYVVAIDLSGHGKSARRSEDATYQVYDDIPQIAAIVEAMSWGSFKLLGHSRGAIISALYAATFPEQVEKLVLLDAIVPASLDEREFLVQMRRFVTDKARLLPRKTRVYPTLEAAIVSREEQGLSREAASLIVERNLRACEGGYTWTTDPRLRGASAMKLSPAQTQLVLQSLTMPALLLMAKDGILHSHQSLMDSLKWVPALESEWVGGGHHFHMEAGVDTLAGRIQKFFQD